MPVVWRRFDTYADVRLSQLHYFIQGTIDSTTIHKDGYALGRKYGISEEKVRTWVSRFRAHGEDGLRAKRSSYSTDFKLEVLYRQDREQLSARKVAALYDIRNPNQVIGWRKGWKPVACRGLKINAGGNPR